MNWIVVWIVVVLGLGGAFCWVAVWTYVVCDYVTGLRARIEALEATRKGNNGSRNHEA